MAAMNAAAYALTARSPCVTRVSHTIAQRPSRWPIGRMEPSLLAASSYDGMALIAKTLARTRGNTGGPAFMEAVKGCTSTSPRGTVSIGPATREIVQTMYIRRIDRQGAKLVATEIDRFDGVKDPVKEAGK